MIAGAMPPVPVDTVSVCAFRVEETWFGMETRQIVEVLGAVTPQRVPLAPAFVAGIVAYRGEALTVVGLRALLGVPPGSVAGCVLVLDDEEGEGSRFGLLVDAVDGVTTAPREALEPNPGSLEARHAAVFDGAFRMDKKLMVRLSPGRLRPERLADLGLY
jgi:purine-binding chemotaxis protein CheW